MAAALIALLVVQVLQSVAVAQQPNASLQEFDWKASGLVHEVRVQLVILVNQLMTNATIMTQVAEGNASALLANLYNDINTGIADAQTKASQIGTAFQMNLSKKVEEAMRQAGTIYTRVEATLRNSTNHIEETAARLLRTAEDQLARAVSAARGELTGGPATPGAGGNVSTTTASPGGP